MALDFGLALNFENRISIALMEKATQLNIQVFMALKTQPSCCILISGAVQILHITACCFEYFLR